MSGEYIRYRIFKNVANLRGRGIKEDKISMFVAEI